MTTVHVNPINAIAHVMDSTTDANEEKIYKKIFKKLAARDELTAQETRIVDDACRIYKEGRK